jgi:hypothetical protein
MAAKRKISVCGWCKHVVDESGMPLPEKIVERESFTERTGVIISDTKCRVCVDSDVELLALRAARKAKNG